LPISRLLNRSLLVILVLAAPVMSRAGVIFNGLGPEQEQNARLYARFAYEVFSRIGTYLLRYQLSRRLVLEAAAGETQTIDLLYTVEKY
jgi:hypothetical protein